MRHKQPDSAQAKAAHWREKQKAYLADLVGGLPHYMVNVKQRYDGTETNIAVGTAGRVAKSHRIGGGRPSVDWRMDEPRRDNPDLIRFAGQVLHLGGVPRQQEISSDAGLENRSYNDLLFLGGELVLSICEATSPQQNQEKVAIGTVQGLTIVTVKDAIPVWQPGRPR